MPVHWNYWNVWLCLKFKMIQMDLRNISKKKLNFLSLPSPCWKPPAQPSSLAPLHHAASKMKPSSAPARPAQLRKTPARWRRPADASGQPSLPPAFTDSSGPQFRPFSYLT